MASRRFGIPAIASFPHLPFYWRTMLDDPRVFRKAMASLRPGLGHWRSLGRQTASMARRHSLRNPADINVLASAAELNIVFLTRYFQPYASRFDDSYVYVGPTIDTTRPETPMEIRKGPEQKLIYIAVGTLYRANLAFFQACMEAFADPGYAVIMSVGKAVDPGALGQVPDNFTVAQFVPQLQVLRAADVFITHGGMNSINEAVAFDVPMVVVPNTVEQSINAARIEQLQCGVYLDHAELSVETLRAAVDRVLTDPAASSGLGRLRESFEEAGGAPLAADVIQEFKAKHGLT
jgi:MGT family glycosyltransferase